MATEAPLPRDVAGPVRAATARDLRAWTGPLLLGLATVVALRLLLGGWALVVADAFPSTPAEQQAIAKQFSDAGLAPQGTGWAAPWERQDAIWYERIALEGYAPDGTTAYFPLLPLLMRTATLLTFGNVAWAGLLIASLAAAIAFAILYRLAALDTDRLNAGRTVAYLALFPTAFFLYSAYTESLFLALVLGAFWCARQGRAAPVALLAALAGLTRVQGALIGIPLAVELLVVGGWQVPARPRLPGRAAINAWLARVTPPDAVLPSAAGVPGLLAVAASGGLATLAFFAYRSAVVHDPLSWTARESALWQQRTTWPGETLWIAVQTLLAGQAAAIDYFDLAVLLTFTALTLGAFRMRPAYGLLGFLVLGSTWLHVRADFPLVSVSRYALGAFPCFIVLAAWAGRRPRPVHLAIIGLWITWLLVWSSQAIRGYWVG